VQLSTKVELLLDLKAAKALGLAVPLSLLGRADECLLLREERQSGLRGAISVFDPGCVKTSGLL
jgi:hypothetical protein